MNISLSKCLQKTINSFNILNEYGWMLKVHSLSWIKPYHVFSCSNCKTTLILFYFKATLPKMQVWLYHSQLKAIQCPFISFRIKKKKIPKKLSCNSWYHSYLILLSSFVPISIIFLLLFFSFSRKCFILVLASNLLELKTQYI